MRGGHATCVCASIRLPRVRPPTVSFFPVCTKNNKRNAPSDTNQLLVNCTLFFRALNFRFLFQTLWMRFWKRFVKNDNSFFGDVAVSVYLFLSFFFFFQSLTQRFHNRNSEHAPREHMKPESSCKSFSHEFSAFLFIVVWTSLYDLVTFLVRL